MQNRPLSIFALAWAIALLGACGENGGPPPLEDTGLEGAAGRAGGPSGAAGGAGVGSATIKVGAATGPLSLPFRVTIKGKGSGAVGNVALDNAVGTVEVQGKKVSAVAHEHQAWPEFGYDLYQTLAVEEGRWHVLWFYCSGAALTGVYRETTDGTLVIYEVASGICEAGAATVAEIALPASTMPSPSLVDGFSLKGPKIAYEPGAPGWIQLGEKMTLLPFNLVDCTTKCGADGWWELHALLWTPEKQRACFAILYLFPGHDNVRVMYALSLPDLGDPAGAVELEASWTGP